MIRSTRIVLFALLAGGSGLLLTFATRLLFEGDVSWGSAGLGMTLFMSLMTVRAALEETRR